MEYRKFGYDKGGNNKDLCCITLYDKETNKTWNYYRETDIVKQKDARIAELEKQLAIRDKALEIACDKIKEFCQNLNTKCCRDYNCKFENNGCNYNDKFNCSKLFIEQAEKELKGEK